MIGLRTNPACRPPPQIAGRISQQRERDEEEAAWEAQIRRVTKHKPREVERAAIRPIPPVRTALDVVSGMKRNDNLLIPKALPIAIGNEHEDLACGKCGTLIASGISRESARRPHPEGDRLIVRCTCRALNLLCGLPGVGTTCRHSASPKAA